ncbi:MAG: DUF3667 domain-containing protein [Steroidobacteraceae bacterium]|nr:DUF3667 domain-containing protein [Steroidobacteraceae bacterium]
MSDLPVPVPPAVEVVEIPPPQTLVCSNCGASLSGEYCSACGQRNEPHIHSMVHFAGEAFESITHADSRLWRTLWYLLAKPGRLTREFFDGKRAAYLPPFRLYLVISVAFFIIGPSEKSNIAIKDSQELELSESGEIRESGGNSLIGGEERDGINTIKVQGLAEFCRAFTGLPDSDNAARDNLRDNCKKITQGDGRDLGRNFLHNLPRAMFVFLPVLAFVMWLLYWKPRRYYVEHLLFLVHNHAFVFLGFSILLLLGRIPYVGDWIGWGWALGLLYMLWYLYRAQRVVYAQTRGLTVAKYTFLLFTYVATGLMMFLLTLLYTAMTL